MEAMRRPKCFRDPLKLGTGNSTPTRAILKEPSQPNHANEPITSFTSGAVVEQQNSHSVPDVPTQAHSSQAPPPPTQACNSNQVPPTSNMEPEASSSSFRGKVGQESETFWTVDPIDGEGATKRLKSKVKNILNLEEGLRVVVEFGGELAPYGEAAGGMCGMMAVKLHAFPINFITWANIPDDYFENCWRDIFQEQIEDYMRQDPDSYSEISPNDPVVKVLGKEHLGEFDPLVWLLFKVLLSSNPEEA